ncbi:MAG: precorrin methylase, partial [Frankiales bacterium]|nr:precorrin methylase [Frankiales bacterium]
MIGLVYATASGRTAAARLAEVWPDTRTYDVRELPAAWFDSDQLVCFFAAGVATRMLAPLLKDKASDPGVVVVDEASRFAVALLGGHGGGANELATRVAGVLGAQPVITTATDATGLPGLDTLGWPVEGAVAAVSRAMLDGTPVRMVADATWPLPPLPVGDVGEHVVRVTDAVDVAHLADGRTAVLRPPSLVLGIGSSSGVGADEVLALVDRVLRDAGLSARSVTAVATADAKAQEPGIVEACGRRGWPLVTFSSERLAAVDVPNPSAAPERAIGTPSVAEAAALLASGGELVVEKQKSAAA